MPSVSGVRASPAGAPQVGGRPPPARSPGGRRPPREAGNRPSPRRPMPGSATLAPRDGDGTTPAPPSCPTTGRGHAAARPRPPGARPPGNPHTPASARSPAAPRTGRSLARPRPAPGTRRKVPQAAIARTGCHPSRRVGAPVAGLHRPPSRRSAHRRPRPRASLVPPGGGRRPHATWCLQPTTRAQEVRTVRPLAPDGRQPFDPDPATGSASRSQPDKHRRTRH